MNCTNLRIFFVSLCLPFLLLSVAVAENDQGASSSARVQDFKIKASGSKESLLIKLDSLAPFSLDQVAANEYSLTINNSSFEKELENLVVPKGAGRIRSVKPTVNSKGTELMIVTEPLTILEATVKDSVIEIHSKGIGKGIVGADLTKEKVLAQAETPIEAKDPAEAATEAKDANADQAKSDDILSDEALSDYFDVDQKYTGRLISLDLQDAEIDNALRIIAEVSNLNIIASDDVTGKITLKLTDVPWDQALDVILKTNGLDKVQEGNVVRIAPVEKLRAEREALKQAQQAEEELEPLKVKYLRISYAKASEISPLAESVLTERGAVAFDERSNQLIVKDISKGISNVTKLIEKLDLRTPQVLIETQIIEAQRTFIRELGAELGFYYLRTPETGNPTGYNFPNSVAIGGTAINATGAAIRPTFSSYPASVGQTALSALFGSADGTKGLNVRLSAAEKEGRVRIVSRPSVAVTNSKEAIIKSVEKLRIKLPSGGVSVATGAGATAAGGAGVATETIEVGIVLNVTAQASPDYYVLLDVNAKSSTLGPEANTIEDIPSEIERSTTSSVLVSSGQTFAMGGIYRITENSGVEGVPYFKDIPFIGHLFRRTLVDDKDEELIFFITPRIIEGSFDDAAMANSSIS